MKQAVAQKDALTGVRWPEGKLNPVSRAELWLQRHQGENYAVSDEDTANLNELETRSDKSFSHPGEIRFRRMGEYLRDGYMGMQPQPQLWEQLRTKALDRGKALGIVLYASDEEPEVAHAFFQGIIDDNTGKWNQAYVSFAWMGLAWQRHLQGDYSTVEEALQFLLQNPHVRRLFPNIDDLAVGARMKDSLILDTLANAFTYNREVHTNHPVLKGLGQIFASHLSRIYEEDFHTCSNDDARRDAIGHWAKNEFRYKGVCPNTVTIVKQGLELGSVEVYSLLKNKELFDEMRRELGTYKLHDYVVEGVHAGVDLMKESNFLWEEIQRFEQERLEEEQRKEEARRRRFEELTRPSSSADDTLSPVDVILDHMERKANDGLTNEELYNRGLRSEFDHERDKEIRECLKNPLPW